MAKYKCPDLKCPEKDILDKPGYCPECGKKLVKISNVNPLLIITAVIVLLFIVGAVALSTVKLTPSNITTNSLTTNSQVNTTPTVPHKTFSKDGITFDYPESWEPNPNGFITIGTGNSGPVTYNAGIDTWSIKEYAAEPPTIPATMDAVIQDMRKDRPGNYDKKEITVAGIKGIEYTPKEYVSQGKYSAKRVDVYFAKGDKLYNLFMTTTNYAADRPGFDMILNTLKIN